MNICYFIVVCLRNYIVHKYINIILYETRNYLRKVLCCEHKYEFTSKNNKYTEMIGYKKCFCKNYLNFNILSR